MNIELFEPQLTRAREAGNRAVLAFFWRDRAPWEKKGLARELIPINIDLADPDGGAIINGLRFYMKPGDVQPTVLGHPTLF